MAARRGSDTGKRVTKTKRPTKAEMDERLIVPLTPNELAEGVLHAGPHPKDVDSDDED